MSLTCTWVEVSKFAFRSFGWHVTLHSNQVIITGSHVIPPRQKFSAQKVNCPHMAGSCATCTYKEVLPVPSALQLHLWSLLTREGRSCHEGEGDPEDGQCGLEPVRVAGHLSGVWHGCSATGCYLQVHHCMYMYRLGSGGLVTWSWVDLLGTQEKNLRTCMVIN